MGGLCSWSEARYSKRTHLRLGRPDFPLADRHLINLRDDHGTSLQARATIEVQLEASFYVPFDPLTEPALAEPIAHLEADDLMRRL
jgi:hypothetical protein